MSEPAWGEFAISSNIDEWIYVVHTECGQRSPHEDTALNLQEAINWASAHTCPPRRRWDEPSTPRGTE